MDSWERFAETRLPDKENFYSKLNDEHITDEEYAHAQAGRLSQSLLENGCGTAGGCF